MAMGAKKHMRIVLMFLFQASLIIVQGRKKKTQDDGDGAGGGFVTCTDVFVAAYHGGTAEENYVGWDFGQAEDNVTMLDTGILLPYCEPIVYKADAGASVTTTVTKMLQSGTETTVTTVTTTSLEEGEGRRLLGLAPFRSRRLLAGDDDAGGDDDSDKVDSTNLPAFEDTCDKDYEYDTCSQKTKEWECNMTDVLGMMTALQKIESVEADDCWNNNSLPFASKCLGAPIGPQTCTTFTKLQVGQYATGMKVTVNGDRCNACALNADLCPRFYDVHNCGFEWTGITTTPPKVGTVFTYVIEVNAAPAIRPKSLLFSLLLAALVGVYSRL